MRRKLIVPILILTSILLVFLLGSCTSLSYGMGYRGNSKDVNNDYHLAGVEHPASGFASVWSSTVRFGENRTGSGFAIFTSLLYSQGERKQGTITSSDSMKSFSIGPAWEFVFSKKFRLLTGIGLTGGSYETEERITTDDETSYIKCNSSLSGFCGFFDTRFFFADHWFLSLRGEVSATLFNEASYDYLIDGHTYHYTNHDHKLGYRYNATLGIGYNI